MPDSFEFRFERDLVDVLRDNSPAALNTRDTAFRVLSETQVGMRIPDLLIVYSRAEQRRVSLKLTYFDCAIIAAAMRSGGVSVADLAESTFSSQAEIGKRVSRLVRLGLLARRENSYLRVPIRVLLTNLRIVAVEAKLTRWKKALVQARECLAFANEAYIAMPSNVIRRNIAALGACADAGVGVLAVDGFDTSVILYVGWTRDLILSV